MTLLTDDTAPTAETLNVSESKGFPRRSCRGEGKDTDQLRKEDGGSCRPEEEEKENQSEHVRSL
jgi:hypothetical protein